jgi:ribosome-binding ATPase YchF (GTP1/OBG family)
VLLSASGIDLAPIKELGLLTAKPFIFVFNVDEAVLTDAARKAELAALVAPAKAVFLDAKIESELIDLDPRRRRSCLPPPGRTSPASTSSRASASTRWAADVLDGGSEGSAAWTIGKGGRRRRPPA